MSLITSSPLAFDSISLGDRQHARHIFVPTAAEHIASKSKLACFIRCQTHSRDCARFQVLSHLEVREAETVLYVFSLDFKDERLAFLRGDFSGRELELLRRHVHYQFGGAFSSRGNHA